MQLILGIYFLFLGFSFPDKASLNSNVKTKMMSKTNDNFGSQKLTHRQYYKNIPIAFSEFREVKLNNKSKIYGNKLNVELELDIENLIPLNKILNQLGNQYKPMQDTLVVLDVGFDNKEYALTYQLYHSKNSMQYFVNAHSGEIELKLPTKYACNTVSCTGTSNHYGVVTFDGCYDQNNYILKSESKNINLWNEDSSSVFSSPLPQNLTTSNTSFFEDTLAVTTYYALEQTYNYFKDTLEYYGLDGDHFPLTAWLVENEYFNYDKVNKAAFIGVDGNVTIDIIVHEIMHGITDLTAGLIYLGESGSLNESFSDIFGEVIEHNTLGTNDWLVNSDIQNNTAPIRDFANPSNYSQPAIYLLDQNWFNDYDDCGGVHQNSGVHNHWFYLLCEGNNEVQAIGIDKAASIAFRNLNTYLFPTAHYKDAKIGSLQAAEDLFGINSFEQNQVQKAWEAVGMFNNTELDSLVLIDLYNKANGDNWQVSWDLSLPINLWHGVVLNNDRRVVELQLNNNNLTNHLSLKIGNLTELTLLDLSNNPTSRTLIFELGNLKKLEYLDLSNSNNSSSYNICTDDYYLSTLSKLPSLTYLDISDNSFKGCYPYQMRKLIKQIPSISDLHISVGNKFDATWSDFINNNYGYCNNCINDFEITDSDDLKFLPQVYNYIKTNGNIILNDTNSLTQMYAGDKIILNSGFEVSKNTNLIIDIKPCNNN